MVHSLRAKHMASIEQQRGQPCHPKAGRFDHSSGLSSQLQNAVPGAMLASKATITIPERRTIQ
jgi:hypothetical protein